MSESRENFLELTREWNSRYEVVNGINKAPFPGKGHLALQWRDADVVKGVGSFYEFEFLKRAIRGLSEEFGENMPELSDSEEVSIEEVQAILTALNKIGILPAHKNNKIHAAAKALKEVRETYISNDYSFEGPSDNEQDGEAMRVALQRKYYTNSMESFAALTTILPALDRHFFGAKVTKDFTPILDEDVKPDSHFSITGREGLHFDLDQGFVEIKRREIGLRGHLAEDPSAFYKDNPHLVLKAAEYAAQRQLPLSHEIKKGIWDNLEAFSTWRANQSSQEDAPDDFQTLNNDFLGILESQNPISDVLWEIDRIGLLGAYSPEFQVARDLPVNFDVHHFTVGQHTLYLFDNLDNLMVSDDIRFEEARPLITDLTPPQLRALRLAMLYHDLGKKAFRIPTDPDHAIRAAQEIVPKSLKTLGLTDADINPVIWLVRNHMMLNHYAGPRVDLESEMPLLLESLSSDPSLQPSYVRLLYLFSNADILSVSPWIERDPRHFERLNALQEEFETFQLTDENQKQRHLKVLEESAAAKRKRDEKTFLEEKAASLQQALGSTDLDLYFEKVPVATLKTTPIEEALRKKIDKYSTDTQAFSGLMERFLDTFPHQRVSQRPLRQQANRLVFLIHLEVLSELQVRGALVLFGENYNTGFERHFEIIVGVAEDTPGTFQRITGGLLFNNFSIQGADIQTASDRTVVDHFHGFFTEDIEDEEGLIQVYHRLAHDLDKLFSMQHVITTEDLFGQDEDASYTALRLGPPQVAEIYFLEDRVVNGVDVSSMTLQSADYVGLLHAVSRVLARLKINLVGAPATTHPVAVRDTFYLNKSGRALTDFEKAELEAELARILNSEKIDLAKIKTASPGLTVRGETVQEQQDNLKEEWQDWLPQEIGLSFKQRSDGSIANGPNYSEIILSADGSAPLTLKISVHPVTSDQINEISVTGNPSALGIDSDEMFRGILYWLQQRGFRSANLIEQNDFHQGMFDKWQQEGRILMQDKTHNNVYNGRGVYHLPGLDLIPRDIERTSTLTWRDSLPRGVSADEISRLEALLEEFEQTNKRTPFYIQPELFYLSADEAEEIAYEDLPVVNRIELLEDEIGKRLGITIKSSDDYFGVQYPVQAGGQVYEIHPYSHVIPGRSPPVNKDDGLEKLRELISEKMPEAETAGTPLYMAFSGRQGTGKTTLANDIRAGALADVISTDDILIIPTDRHLINHNGKVILNNVNVQSIIALPENKNKKLIIIEGVQWAHAFGTSGRVLKDKPDILIYTITRDPQQTELWRRIVERPHNEVFGGPEHILKTAIPRNVYYRYFGFDLAVKNADIIFNTSISVSPDYLSDDSGSSSESRKIIAVPGQPGIVIENIQSPKRREEILKEALPLVDTYRERKAQVPEGSSEYKSLEEVEHMLSFIIELRLAEPADDTEIWALYDGDNLIGLQTGLKRTTEDESHLRQFAFNDWIISQGLISSENVIDVDYQGKRLGGHLFSAYLKNLIDSIKVRNIAMSTLSIGKTNDKSLHMNHRITKELGLGMKVLTSSDDIRYDFLLDLAPQIEVPESVSMPEDLSSDYDEAVEQMMAITSEMRQKTPVPGKPTYFTEIIRSKEGREEASREAERLVEKYESQSAANEDDMDLYIVYRQMENLFSEVFDHRLPETEADTENLALYHNNKIVGFRTGKKVTREDKASTINLAFWNWLVEEGLIRSEIVIEPMHQGEGLGSYLTRQYFEYLINNKNKKYRYVTVNISQSNKRAFLALHKVASELGLPIRILPESTDKFHNLIIDLFPRDKRDMPAGVELPVELPRNTQEAAARLHWTSSEARQRRALPDSPNFFTEDVTDKRNIEDLVEAASRLKDRYVRVMENEENTSTARFLQYEEAEEVMDYILKWRLKQPNDDTEIMTLYHEDKAIGFMTGQKQVALNNFGEEMARFNDWAIAEGIMNTEIIIDPVYQGEGLASKFIRYYLKRLIEARNENNRFVYLDIGNWNKASFRSFHGAVSDSDLTMRQIPSELMEINSFLIDLFPSREIPESGNLPLPLSVNTDEALTQLKVIFAESREAIIQGVQSGYEQFKRAYLDLVARYEKRPREISNLFGDILRNKPELKGDLQNYLIRLATSESDASEDAVKSVVKILRSAEIGEVVLTSPESMWGTGSGGLALAVTDIARELADLGISVTVVNPLFQADKASLFKKYNILDTGRTFTVPFNEDGSEVQEVKIYELERHGVRILYLENEEYFNQLKGRKNEESAYGGTNRHKLRFSRLLSLGTLKALREMEIQPGIIQTNDWTTGYLKAYLEGRERIDMSLGNLKEDSQFERTQVVSILHNAHAVYQGRVFEDDPNNIDQMVRNDLGFSTTEDHDVLFLEGQETIINPTVTAVITADRARTVSEGYHKRTLDPKYDDQFGGLGKLFQWKESTGTYDGMANGFALNDRQSRILRKSLYDKEFQQILLDKVINNPDAGFETPQFRGTISKMLNLLNRIASEEAQNSSTERTKEDFEKTLRGFQQIGDPILREVYAKLWIDYIHPFQKQRLQQAISLEENPDKFLYSMLHRTDPQKGHQLLLGEIWDINGSDTSELKAVIGGLFEEMVDEDGKEAVKMALADFDIGEGEKAEDRLRNYALANGRTKLRAIEILLILRPEVQFVVAGSITEGDYYDQGFTEIAANFPEQFRYITSINQNDALYDLIYSGSTRFGMPSWFEPGGLSNQEAAASGTPRHTTQRDGLLDGEIKLKDEAGNVVFEEGFLPFNPVAWVSSFLKHYNLFKGEPALERELKYQALIQDNRWLRSAKNYIEKYAEATGIDRASNLAAIEIAAAIQNSLQAGSLSPANRLMERGFTTAEAADIVINTLKTADDSQLIDTLINTSLVELASADAETAYYIKEKIAAVLEEDGAENIANRMRLAMSQIESSEVRHPLTLRAARRGSDEERTREIREVISRIRAFTDSEPNQIESYDINELRSLLGAYVFTLEKYGDEITEIQLFRREREEIIYFPDTRFLAVLPEDSDETFGISDTLGDLSRLVLGNELEYDMSTRAPPQPRDDSYWVDFDDVTEISMYRVAVHPVVSEVVRTIINQLLSDKESIEILDIFGGDGSFIKRLHSDLSLSPNTSQSIKYHLIEGNKRLYQLALRNLEQGVQLEALGTVLHQKLPAENRGLTELIGTSPDIIVATGALTQKVVKNKKQAIDILNSIPDGAYVILTGLMPSLLNAEDFSRLDFDVHNYSIPSHTLSGRLPRQLYVLQKNLSEARKRPEIDPDKDFAIFMDQSNLEDQETLDLWNAISRNYTNGNFDSLFNDQIYPMDELEAVAIQAQSSGNFMTGFGARKLQAIAALKEAFSKEDYDKAELIQDVHDAFERMAKNMELTTPPQVLNKLSRNENISYWFIMAEHADLVIDFLERKWNEQDFSESRPKTIRINLGEAIESNQPQITNYLEKVDTENKVRVFYDFDSSEEYEVLGADRHSFLLSFNEIMKNAIDGALLYLREGEEELGGSGDICAS